MRFMPITPSIEINGHLITELAIIKWNACYGLHHFAALLTPFMNFIKLQAYQPTGAEFGQRTNQLDSSYPKLDFLLRPGLRDQIQSGDDAPGCNFFNDCEIIWVEGWMRPREQVARPGRDMKIRLIKSGVAVNAPAKISQGLCIRWRGAAQDQAVAQVT